MATSLAQQLQKLAVPQTQVLLRDKKRASLLFDPKEAAGIDRDTFYDIGISGLKELQKYNPEFAAFESSLFGKPSRQIERAVEDRDTNRKLNKTIRKFLHYLSPYFLLKPAHKSLEWLIHRFSIHEYNKEDVLRLILPYHETNIFVRFLQLLDLRNEADRWGWLRPMQKSGVHLTKSVLFNRDVAFLRFVTNMTVEAVRECGPKATSLTTLFTFYCTCTVGALDRGEVTEEVVSAILVGLLKGFGSPVPDFTAAAFVITAQLLKKCRLKAKVLDQLVAKLANGRLPHLRGEAVLLTVLLYESQGYEVVSEKALENLLRNDWIAAQLGRVAKSGVHVVPFLSPLLVSLLANAAKDESRKLIEALIDEIHDRHTDDLIAVVLRNCPEASDRKTAEWCGELIRSLEKRYPGPFDRVISGAMSTGSRLRTYLNFVTSNVDIFERFYHPNATCRRDAVAFLVNNYPTLSEKERDIFRSGIVERLLDDDKSVVEACFGLKPKYLRQLLGNATDVLLRVLRHARKNNWHDVSEKVITTICNQRTDQKPRIFFAILPSLLPRNDKELALAKRTLNTEFASESPVLVNLRNAVGSRDVSAVEFRRRVYGAMSCGALWDFEELLDATDDGNVSDNYLAMVTLTCASVTVQNVSIGGSFRVTLTDASRRRFFQILKVLEIVEAFAKSTRTVSSNDDEKFPFSTSILQAVNAGRVPLQGVVQCLKSLVERSPRIDAKNRWFNFLAPDESALLNRYARVLFEGCAVAKTSRQYAPIVRTYLEKFAPTFTEKVELLCNVTVANDGVLQLRAMKVLNAIMARSEQSRYEIVVPTILTTLSSPVKEIRHIAVEILGNVSSGPFRAFLTELRDRREEILTDSEQLSLMLFAIFDGKHKDVLAALIDIVTDATTPRNISAELLKILRFVDDVDILARTAALATTSLDDADRLSRDIFRSVAQRVNGATARRISLDSPEWGMISKAIRSGSAIAIIEQVDRDVFAAFAADVQRATIRLLSEVVAETDDPDVVSAVRRVVRRIDLDARLVVDGLVAMQRAKSEKIDANRKRLRQLVPTADILETGEWTRGVALLEFVQDKKKITNTAALLPVLFGVLKKCLDFDEQTAVEYPKQLLLSAILQCCQKEAVASEAAFNMELIVQCVRASQNPQTHHHALLVLAHTAALIPDQVLHNIMAIFTFMGSSVLRHDDAYSFQIISKIIETVVPILTAAGDSVRNVLRVFVDVMVDVPEHRRLLLFKKLLSTLGVDDYLWTFLLLVFESHVTVKSTKRLQDAREIVLEFPPAVVISTTIKLLEHLASLPEESVDCDAFKTHTPKQFRHYKYTLVTFTSGLLSAKSLVDAVASVDNHEMEALYKSIIVCILKYIQAVSKASDRAGGTAQAQYWKVLLHHCCDILDSVNALLTPEMFLLVVRGLVVHNLVPIRRKALELLNAKLQHDSKFFTDEAGSVSTLINLLPSLVDIVKTVGSEADPEHELLQQTTFLTLKLLIKLLAEAHPEKFTPLIDFTTGLIKGKAQGNVLASVVLCLAELVATLRAHAIPGLAKYMPAIIKLLRAQNRQDSSNLLLVCVVTALQKIIETLPLFLSPYLEKLLFEIAVMSAREGALAGKLETMRGNVGGSVPPRILVPIIGETYATLLAARHYDAIGPLMSILSESLSRMKPPELPTLLPDLTTFFLSALEFRCGETDLAAIETVEDRVIRSLTTVVLKMSETTFRPFFYRLYNWAMRGDTRSDRVITFYRSTHRIADSLKSLFVLFAGHFVKNAATILDECNAAKTTSLYFEDERKCVALLESVLGTLRTVLSNDSQSFIDKDRFEALMQPLVDQLENGLVREADSVLIPCIALFAVSTGDDSLWKRLNYQVLLKTRHDLPEVRMNGLKCILAVSEKIGEDFLPLLPETIPFLSELLEDEDERVEGACQRAVQEMERILGEPLQKYF